MIIKWFGLNCIQIKSKNRIIIIDPFSKKTGLKMPALKSDITLVTKESDQVDTTKIKKRKDGKILEITAPGEYETKSIIVKGIDVGKGITIYAIYLENIAIAHLGNLTKKELSTEQLEQLNNVDVLIIPIGGKDSINDEQAIDLAQQIEPRIIIPIYYHTPGLKENLKNAKTFIKNEGAEKVEPQSEIKISKASLPQEETDIIILKP